MDMGQFGYVYLVIGSMAAFALTLFLMSRVAR